jgi:hypothetical protein
MKYFLISLLLLSMNTQASLFNPGKRISRLMMSKLNQMDEGLEQISTPSAPLLYQGEDETAYYLKRIRLQFCPSVAFDIKIFEVKFKPIIEFRWTRKNPVGWVNYRKHQ